VRPAGLVPAHPRQGHRWNDHRTVINGILFRTRTECPRRDLPGEYGNWKTVYGQHRRWSLDGTWGKILDRLRAGCSARSARGRRGGRRRRRAAARRSCCVPGSVRGAWPTARRGCRWPVTSGIRSGSGCRCWTRCARRRRGRRWCPSLANPVSSATSAFTGRVAENHGRHSTAPSRTPRSRHDEPLQPLMAPRQPARRWAPVLTETVLLCYGENVKNITVSVPDEVYRDARVAAAERDTSVSALVVSYLQSVSERARDFSRQEAQQHEVQAEIGQFRAADRMSRDQVHDRAVH